MTRPLILAALLTVWLAPVTAIAAEHGDTLQEILDKVDARCPAHFPKRIQPIPSDEELAQKSTDELFAMMESWNNVTGTRVAQALAQKGPDLLARLIETLKDKNRFTRAAALRAIESIVSRQVKAVEENKEVKAAGNRERKKYVHLVPYLSKLVKDPCTEVRRALIGPLNEFRDVSVDATLALTMLWNDPDEYLCESAIRAICYRGWGWDAFAKLSREQRLAAVRRGFESELGSGRQHMMEIVKRLSKEEKTALVPDMLKNLKVHPDRNMMFRDGGRWGCMEILTELGVKEALPPMFATLRTERSDFLFDAAAEHVRNFDPGARRMATPDLKKYIVDLERRRVFFNDYITHDLTRENLMKDYDKMLKKAQGLLKEIESTKQSK